MNGIDCPAAFWFCIAAQFLGLFSAWLARVSEGSSCQAAVHSLFFASLALMGAATLMAFAIGPGCWLASATTLAIMILAATCDFRPRQQVDVD